MLLIIKVTILRACWELFKRHKFANIQNEYWISFRLGITFTERLYLIGNICVGVKAENFGDVLKRHIDDVVDVLFNVFVVGKRIALVKLESRLQQRVAEPDVCERHQKPFVEIVSYAAAVLNLKWHFHGEQTVTSVTFDK